MLSAVVTPVGVNPTACNSDARNPVTGLLKSTRICTFGCEVSMQDGPETITDGIMAGGNVVVVVVVVVGPGVVVVVVGTGVVVVVVGTGVVVVVVGTGVVVGSSIVATSAVNS
jgi:hypothetical protein